MNVQVIDGENSTAGVLTACGLALISSGIEVKDVLIGASITGDLEINSIEINRPYVIVGYLPNANQIVFLNHVGESTSEEVIKMTDVAIQACIEQHKFIRSNLAN